MEKDQAVVNLKNLLAVETRREAITADEALAFQDAITNGKVDALKKMYTGPDGKLSLSPHDLRLLHESCDALGSKSASKAAKKTAKKSAVK